MSELSERVMTATLAERPSVAFPLTSDTREVPAYTIARWQGRTFDYCVIIPVINEGERIGRLLARMGQLGIARRADIIVVDGGSTDDSLATPVLDRAAVRGLLVKTGPGRLSAQLRCAYAFALEQGYAGIITIDGNDKDDPQSLPTFIDALERGYDFVQASRFIDGAVEERTPLKRRVAIRWVHAPLTSFASGFAWTDTTQGYRAYSRQLLESPEVAPFRQCFKDYELLAYLSCRAPQLGFRCIELPTARRYPQGEAIPTKISSLRGELAVFKTLLAACVGRFDPPPRRVNPQFVAWMAVAGVLLLAVALRAALWALHRDFWIDEAMLYAAIEHESVLRPWLPLAWFEQSAPYFLALLWQGMIGLAGPNELVLRLPSLLASIGALTTLGIVARRKGLGPWGTGAALAIAGLSEVAIVQAAQFKQYSFELLATTLILLTADRAVQKIRSGRLPVSFLIVSILMLPVAYAAPVVTTACAVAVLLTALLPDEQHRFSSTSAQRRPTAIWRLVLLSAPWAVCALLWQRYAVTPSTYFQLTAYPYAQYFLSLGDPDTWRFLSVPFAPLKPQLGSAWLSDIAAGTVAVVWCGGLAIGWKRHVFAHAAAATLLSLFVALSLLHVLPFAASRHFLFALPIFALSFGAAVQACFAMWPKGKPLTAGAVAAVSSVLLLILASAFLRTGDAHGEEVRKALSSEQGQRCQTIWTYYAAWPAVLVYRQTTSATFLGEVAPQSAAMGWTAPVRQRFPDYVRDTRDLLARYPQVCLLFSHSRDQEEAQLIAAASASHNCHLIHQGRGVSLHDCRSQAAAVLP